LYLIGCASTTSNLHHEEKQTALRTFTGGVLGVLVEGNTLGAIAGAFVGDVVVELFIKREEKPLEEPIDLEEEAKRKEKIQRTAKLFIEELLVEPQKVKTGSIIEANVRYSLYVLVPTDHITITEKMILSNTVKEMELVTREVVRTEGEHIFNIKFTVPDDIPKGDYTLLTTISMGNYAKRARSSVRII
jgi:Na+/glutamate symporter